MHSNGWENFHCLEGRSFDIRKQGWIKIMNYESSHLILEWSAIQLH